MTDIPYNRPPVNADTAPYWQACRKGELLFQCCGACREPVFPPRALCPYCLADSLQWTKSSGRGRVYSFTIQHVPLYQRTQQFTPRALGIIAMNEGYHLFTEILAADVDAIALDDAVEVQFEAVDDELTLPKFKRVTAATHGS